MLEPMFLEEFIDICHRMGVKIKIESTILEDGEAETEVSILAQDGLPAGDGNSHIIAVFDTNNRFLEIGAWHRYGRDYPRIRT